MTTFGQAIVNGGRYGGVRLLSPAAVAAMTRDQIPGIEACFLNKIGQRASWGYGWAVASPSKWRYFDGSLLAQECILDPLGMKDCFYIVPESEAGRVVGRPLDSVGGAPESPLNQGIASRQMQETPYGGGGVFGTPRDVLTLGQMFLNGGVYGDARLLSAASVAAMTRDQIPGTKALFLGHDMERAGWGYGWGIETPTKWAYYRGSLRSLGCYDHGGFGGTFTWVDPLQDLVAAYFEVALVLNDNMEMLWNADLFQNVIGAAVDE